VIARGVWAVVMTWQAEKPKTSIVGLGVAWYA